VIIKDEQIKDTEDSAAIYQPRKQQTEKQKLRDMTFKEKVIYFNDYYRFKSIAILAILSFAIYVAYSILVPKPETILYAAVINYALTEESALTLQSDFGQHLEINPKKEELMIDTSFFLGGKDDAAEYSHSSEQKLGTYFFAGEIDVIIAPESNFAKYTNYGYFDKLSDQLPTDLFSSLADSFYSSDTEDDSSVSAYGIYLDGATIYDNQGEIIDRPVLGIVANSKYKPNAIELIRYLFQLY